VKAGWAFIAMGVVGAAWGRHADVYVMGAFLVALGIVVLFVKEEAK
jgi:hypothetical protein